MNDIFVLDACALIALLAGERGINVDGAENVKNIIQEAIDENIIVKINQINLLEVYYKICNVYNQDEANRAMEKIKEFPIEIIVGLNEDVFNEAGRIKSKQKIPLGDSIAVAECIIGNGTLVTSDHNDIGKMETAENIKVYWFR